MDSEIQRSGSRISIKGSIHPPNLRTLLVALHKTIEDREFFDVILDYSLCDYVAESVMLPLMPILAKYRKEGTEFRLIFPLDENLKRLFLNANWAHHIEPDRHDLNTYEGGHVPALRFDDGGVGDSSDILDRVMNLILRQLETERATLKAVEWSLGEIMDNVSNHAESSVGGFVQATAYRERNQVEFVVADAGIGIPQSMNMLDHKRALQDAIHEGVTKDSTKNAGNGLYGSFRVATLSGGQFEIDSKNGVLYTKQDGDVVCRNLKIPYQGTSVRCRVGLGDPDLLGKALRFRGEPHDPSHDFIERQFETDEGDLTFNMREKAGRDLGSRQGGARVRGVIRNLLRERGSIMIDFDGIGVVSSSFADEVFGRLFVDMGPRAFMTQIEMRNVDPTVGGLIDRAIVQRTRLGNGDDGTPDPS